MQFSVSVILIKPLINMSFMLFNAGEDAEVFQRLAAENAFPFLKIKTPQAVRE